MLPIFRNLSFLILLCSLTAPVLAFEGLPAAITADFQPASGVVIMPLGDEYLIDLDAAEGVGEGDLISVVKAGQRVVHPVIGEVLGTLDEVIGLLQVVRVKSGYSYARPVGEHEDFSKGAEIRRFENIATAFWDYQGDGEVVYQRLRARLPGLEWQSYARAQAQRPAKPKPLPGGKPPLMFIYKGGSLEVRGASFEILASYSLEKTGRGSSVATTPVPAAPGAAAPVVIDGGLKSTQGIVAAPVQTSTAAIKHAAPLQPQSQEQIWNPFQWSGNPLGVEVDDFDGDGNLETAILFRDRVHLFRFQGGEPTSLVSIPLPRIDKALKIDSADIDGNGKPEIFVTAIDHFELSSFVIDFTNGNFGIAQQNLRFFFQRQRLSDGSVTLLGQRLGDDLNLYSTTKYQMTFAQGRWQSGKRLDLPSVVNIFGLQQFRDSEGAAYLATLNLNDRLRVLSASGDELWKSSKRYGGSVAFFPQEDNTGGADYAKKFVYLKPRLDLRGETQVLAPINEGGRLNESFSSLGPCQVVALHWDGSSMQKDWETTKQEGTLADFRLADIDNDGKDEVVMLIHFSRAGVKAKGKAGLRVFEFD